MEFDKLAQQILGEAGAIPVGSNQPDTPATKNLFRPERAGEADRALQSRERNAGVSASKQPWHVRFDQKDPAAIRVLNGQLKWAEANAPHMANEYRDGLKYGYVAFRKESSAKVLASKIPGAKVSYEQ